MKAVYPYNLRLSLILSQKDKVKIQLISANFKDGKWYNLQLATKIKKIFVSKITKIR